MALPKLCSGAGAQAVALRQGRANELRHIVRVFDSRVETVFVSVLGGGDRVLHDELRNTLSTLD